jgi:hypothetical protein
MMKQQHTLMKFDPATGEPKPYPSHADQWRGWHGKATAWIFNPWSGERRDAGDVGSDPFGRLILPPGEPVYAASENTERAELQKVAGDLNRLRARVEGVLWPNSGMAHGT